jgi:starch synthase
MAKKTPSTPAEKQEKALAETRKPAAGKTEPETAKAKPETAKTAAKPVGAVAANTQARTKPAVSPEKSIEPAAVKPPPEQPAAAKDRPAAVPSSGAKPAAKTPSKSLPATPAAASPPLPEAPGPVKSATEPKSAGKSKAPVAEEASPPVIKESAEPVAPAAEKKSAGKSRASDQRAPLAKKPPIPSESEFVAGHLPLPQFDPRPESLEKDIPPAPAEQFSLPPVTEYAATSDWETMPMSESHFEPEPQPEYQEYHDPGPSIPSLFIVQISPELAPVAKVGGLADVVFGLANEMEIRGNHVEIILPKYDCLRYDHIWGLCETYRDLWVPWYGGVIHCTVFFGFVHGRKCFFIEPHSGDNFFNRGCVYGFNDDVMRFAFFTRAAMEFLWKSGKNPDIIHCHDWQTALAPLFLFEIYQHLGMWHPRVCFTIHNFKHQGVTGAQLLHATGLHRPDYYFHYDRIRDNQIPHALNLMKAGVVYANFVTTVSPRHAFEAKDQGQGFGLEPSLHIHHGKYGGVVNGIDYGFWNPEMDHYIPQPYGMESVDDKYANKRALRERLMLADNEKPIVAFVGRLDPQKGLELIRHAIFYTLQRGGQFVLLGSSPDGQINNYFWSLKHQLNDNPDCHIEIGFNEELSHLIYAGADIMVVPSRFEPCGLTQLIAMRYGAIPVVREVGGLADTVFDKDFSPKPLHERNGYVFRDYNEGGLESALGRAISCYYEYPEHFRELIKNAMRCDYSWNHPGQDYMNIYNYIRDK